MLRRPDIAGAQLVYTWKSLETARDRYDFSQIEHDLTFLGWITAGGVAGIAALRAKRRRRQDLA